MFNTASSEVKKYTYRLKDGRVLNFDVKHDDAIDAIVSGNKWRKLKLNIACAVQNKMSGILTFGGAHSNHLVATAKAAQLAGLKSIGVVRGDELTCDSNETLRNCNQFGMELQFIPRNDFREFTSMDYQPCLKDSYPGYHIVPEGGANFYGVIGCQEILKELPSSAADYDHIFVAAGTGTTAAGLALSLNDNQLLHVVPALKGDFHAEAIKKMIYYATFSEEETEAIIHQQIRFLGDYHFGGYTKYNEELIEFIRDVAAQLSLYLDPIYTAKALYALVNEVKKGNIPPTEKLLFIHTGGLQGVKAFEEKIGQRLFL
jgi:1-aminocyclopropane-1-carboxylate deaminase